MTIETTEIADHGMPVGAVAVVGMSLRVPGARTLDDFWRNLRDGVESIRTFTDEELLAAGVTPEEIARPGFVRAFGALDDIAGFDAAFFGFSPREAQLLDPQHRLFLECAWEALEHAGCPGDGDETVTGVYAGVGESSYLLRNLLAEEGLVERIGAFQTSLGNDKDFMPTRVSYKLNLRGPSVSVQTGCSTSLVAVHMACQALANGECDVALAGGATVVATQDQGYRYEEGGVVSPDGHCRAFDEGASGTVPGSGAGVVVLKRLDDALADGDVIHAVIRGSAINNDGARKVGFTAPSVEGQADVIAEALEVSGTDPATVSYVEAHGTGTPLGDPIEVAALKSAFAEAGEQHRCALGSVKTNIGHLDTAAGVVGLIKTVLAMRARELPPTLHHTSPNPRLALEEGPFHVNAALTPWRAEVLRAGVSSFGIGGTNAHVVLEEAPERAAATEGSGPRLLPLSAATPTALDTVAADLAAHLRSHPEERLDEVAHTLQNGRRALAYRRFVVAENAEEAVAALLPGPGSHVTDAARETVFAFSGQGTQRVGMGRALYEREPVFRAEVDRAAGILLPCLGRDIRALLYPADAERDAAHAAMGSTRYAQPALFVVEFALAKLWMSWGVRPAAMLGHSLGELVAACLSGVLSFEDALRLVAERGRLMQEAAPGAMVAVPLPEDEVTALLTGELALAAVNGPHECVVSGPADAVETFEALLAGREVAAKRLRTSHAFHSAMMDAAATAFEALLARTPLAAPRIPFASNVTGTWVTDEQATSPAYWAGQLRSTVRFDDCLRTVRAHDAVLLEIGPGRVLTGLARVGSEGRAAVASLPTAAEDGDARREVLTAAGELWCQGVPIDWPALPGDASVRRTVLPTYPFERDRHWVDAPRGGSGPRTGADGLRVRGLRRSLPAAARPAGADAGAWLVVTDGPCGVLGALVERLRAGHGEVTAVPAAVLSTPQECARLVAGEHRLAGVVFGGFLDGAAGAEDTLTALCEAVAERGDAGTRVIVVASGVLDVTGAERLVPARASLAAWASAGRPGTRTLLDITAPGTPGALHRLTAMLHAEVSGPAREPVVGLRGAHRFVPELEPLHPATDAGRHRDTHYALLGDEPLTAAFHRALTGAGATAGPSPADGAVALVLLDASAPQADVLQRLTDAAALVEGAPPTAVRACEVHIFGDAPASSVIESQVALIARDSRTPWTVCAWPRAGLAAVEAAVPRVVGAAPGACQVVVGALEEPEEATAPTAAEDAPLYTDDTERQVAAVLCDLLGVRNIDAGADFFHLGGHSLLAAQVVTRIRKDCDVELPLRALVADPTVRGIAAAVRDARTQDTAATAVEALPVVVPDPEHAHDPFPLTDVQQAYLVGRTGVFELGNVGMHAYEEFDVPGLDLPRMQRAFRRLIGRHGMLRAIVHPHGEQEILAEVPDYVIETEDLRDLPEDEARARLEATREAMSHQVFSPECWPLFELRATVLPGDVGRLHLSVDGLITDAWAYNLLMRELTHLYGDPDAALPELELSFRDYVLAEHGLESTERFRGAERYWQERIPELALAPELPLARDPRTIETPRFARTAGELPRGQWAALRAAAARRGITPTSLLLAAYAEALGTWSKNRRFTLNLPLANRLPLHPEVDAIIGDFTSLTLLELDTTAPVPFLERAAAVRDRLVADLDHRLFSGVRVLREMKKVRGDSAAAMPAVFTSLLANDSEEGQLGEIAYSISQTPQVWIDAQVYESDGALVLDIDAVEELFPEGMVAAIHAATLSLLRHLAEDEANWDRPAPLLVPAADLAAQEEYNRTEGPLPSGFLHAPFFAQAARTPERPAVITPHRVLNYGELAARAHHIAARLGELDVRPNDLVAVVMEKGWEQSAAVLGILAAGAAYLPIDPELPAERIRFLLEHGRARAVLTQARVAAADEDRFAGVRTVLAVDELPYDPAAAARPLPRTATTPRDLAYVIFTSGSTGLPKGVMIDHRGALNTVVDINERFSVGADDRVLALSSLSFDLSVYDVFGPLAVGGAVVVPDAGAHRDPAAWLDLVTGAEVTLWNSVPALMELLVEHMTVKEITGGPLRTVMLSGDWIPVTLPDRIRRTLGSPEVISLGGATEASIWSILHPVGEVPEDWASIPYGRPMRNQTFHVLDEALRPRPTNVPGQLYIGGVGLACGYLRDEVKTNASFITHPETGQRLYRTGDLGRFLPSGEIEFLGREDFQVKVQGYRIELGEIEAALMQHLGVRAAVVVVQGEQRGAKRLIAFVVPQDGGRVPEDVIEFLGAKLPAYMVPGVYLELDSLPLTANGKVDRRALVVPDDLADDDAPQHEAPRTPIEQTVADIWAGMLGAERVGLNDNFFALGGDSLLAMRSVIRLRKELDVELPIRTLFDSPTLRDVAAAVEDQILAELEHLTDEEAEALLSS
ncbi:hybrid non-ribosomal peptide synthetase/type I polyketide synthase [Streptomyces sp. NPDC001920]